MEYILNYIILDLKLLICNLLRLFSYSALFLILVGLIIIIENYFM